MLWDDIARVEHRRNAERYLSDMMEREWAILAPLSPPEKKGVRKRTTDSHEVMSGLLHIASISCPWRMLLKDFPPMTMVQGYSYAWRDDGLWLAINHALAMAARELEGRGGELHYWRDRQPVGQNLSMW